MYSAISCTVIRLHGQALPGQPVQILSLNNFPFIVRQRLYSPCDSSYFRFNSTKGILFFLYFRFPLFAPFGGPFFLTGQKAAAAALAGHIRYTRHGIGSYSPLQVFYISTEQSRPTLPMMKAAQAFIGVVDSFHVIAREAAFFPCFIHGSHFLTLKNRYQRFLNGYCKKGSTRPVILLIMRRQ